MLMANSCCCFNTRDPEEDVCSTHQNCICPICIFHKLFRKKSSLSSDVASSNAQSNNNIVTSAPRTMHFDDANVTGWNLKQVGEIREGEIDDMEQNGKGNKSEAEAAPVCELLEDEDVCPTCLEEYISENPKIVLQCSHSYHLSCIYEWMERSTNCPICDKTMIFDEAA